MLQGKIISDYMTRHTQKQKHQFLGYIETEFRQFGYKAKVDKKYANLIPNYNLIVGDLEQAEIILTAHFDTPNTIIGGTKMYPNNFIRALWMQMRGVLVILVCSGVISGLVDITISQIGLLLFILYGLTFTNKNNMNDNTSGVLVLYNIAQQLSEKDRERVAFVLFDNEEKGLLGSLAFKEAYNKLMQDKLLINFDCVGLGEHILIGTKKKHLNIAEAISQFNTSDKQVEAYIKKNPLLMSDDANFKKSIQVMSFEKRKGQLELDYIHTNKDIHLDEKNIEVITQMMINYIEADNMKV